MLYYALLAHDIAILLSHAHTLQDYIAILNRHGKNIIAFVK